MNIRAYEASDFMRIAQIHDEARKVELEAANLCEAFLTLEQTYESEGLFDNRVAVAELGGDVVGFVAYSGDEITWLYADQSCPRRGIGEALLRYAIAQCGDTVTLEVLQGNNRALSLYLKVGFSIKQTLTGKLVGNEGFDAAAHVMELTKKH